MKDCMDDCGLFIFANDKERLEQRSALSITFVIQLFVILKSDWSL